MSATLQVQNTYPNLQNQNNLNGNVTTDSLNKNTSAVYDHRNLITELYHIDTLTSTRQYSYATRYWYDETGNRVRKLTYRIAQIPPPQINDWANPGNGWTLLNNEHYVRGVDGKELATYSGNTLTEWYVWASDMVGKIKGNAKYFFFAAVGVPERSEGHQQLTLINTTYHCFLYSHATLGVCNLHPLMQL